MANTNPTPKGNDMRETVRVDTQRYVRSHGHQPKGTGGWMFLLILKKADGSWPKEVGFTKFGTLTEARKAALADARKVEQPENCTSATLLVMP